MIGLCQSLNTWPVFWMNEVQIVPFILSWEVQSAFKSLVNVKGS